MTIYENEDQVSISVYRLSFGAFVYRAFQEVYPEEEIQPSFHIDAICYYLQQMVEGKKPPRLVLNLPPRSLKSFIVSVCLPAWVLGRRHSAAVVCVSYSHDLAKKFSRECRTLLESDFFGWIFPSFQLSPNKITETEFETIQNGFRLATSVGGTLTGRGADLLIVDDPVMAQKAHSESILESATNWFNTTAVTRLNSSKNSIVILTMQRLHEDDLAGALIKANWPYVVIPAVAEHDEHYQLSRSESYYRKKGEVLQPLRNSIEAFEELKTQLGSADYFAQYQQNPIPAEGNAIKALWLQDYEYLPRKDFIWEAFITVDPASKPGQYNDHTAILAAVPLANQLYVLECMAGHWTMAEILTRIKDMAARHNVQIIVIEDTAIGPGLIQELRGSTRLSILAHKPRGKKDERLYNQIGHLESGRVFLPKASWRPDFDREVLGFPNARYDDQVDVLIMAMERFGIRQAAKGSVRLVGPIIVTTPKGSYFDYSPGTTRW